MKFKVGDQVIITGGKDKGKKGAVIRVLPASNKVVVEGMNIYVKHVKPMGERSGQRLELPRPLPTAKVAIINDKGQADRIAYQVSKDGQKTRIFKKTGEVIKYAKEAKK
jgi:large subunit ribosomal protein L24